MTASSRASRIEAFRAAEAAYLASLGIEARERFVRLERLGITGRYLEVGEGSPVVMIHGGGGTGCEWAPLVPHLEGHRLILVDRPGFGLTDFVDYRGVDLRRHAIDFVDDVLEAAVAERPAVVANSMGALWSLLHALEHPGRLGPLSLVGTPALILDTAAPAGMRLLGVPGLNRAMMALESPSPGQARRLLGRLGHDPAAVGTSEMVELVTNLERLPDYRRAWLSLLENAIPFGRVNPRLRLGEEELGRICNEVLYLWGERDPFGSLDVARRARRATPGAELEVVGVGHLPWLDEPEICGARTREFFERTT